MSTIPVEARIKLKVLKLGCPDTRQEDWQAIVDRMIENHTFPRILIDEAPSQVAQQRALALIHLTWDGYKAFRSWDTTNPLVKERPASRKLNHMLICFLDGLDLFNIAHCICYAIALLTGHYLL